MASQPELRVGSVPYLVARPLDFGLEHEPGLQYVRAVPAQLVAGLRDGSLDVALVSSVELFRQPGYRYLDGLAVAGESFVSSVQLFLRKPLAEVTRVALDPASRTSAALVQAMLAEAQDLHPEFLDVEPGVDPRDAEADAWLCIGDPALRQYLATDAPPVFNPSQVWREQTGLPFVFAAWIARPGTDLDPHLPAFSRARRAGAARIGALAATAAADAALPADAVRRYLAEECVYELESARMRASLSAFRDRLGPLGLCRADLDPASIPLPSAD